MLAVKHIPDSAVLLHDPTIKSFHSEHIPYVVLAYSTLLVVFSASFVLTSVPNKTVQESISSLWLSKMGHSSSNHGHLSRMV